jgi:protein-disulfide isomerase
MEMPKYSIIYSILFSLILITAIDKSGSGQELSTKQVAVDGRTEMVAVVDGQHVITRKEIDDLVGSQLYNLQLKIYNLRKNALDNLLTKMALEHEAKARGITVEDLKKQIMPERVEIDESRIDELYAENAGNLGNMSEDEARQRIRLDIENRARMDRYKAAISAIKNKARIEIVLTEPIPPLIRVSDNGPSKGPRAAPVIIVEFSDYQCPYCKQATETLKQVLQRYGHNVRLVFKQLPLPIHKDAFNAAQASVCAEQQGKFWEYHDRLFNSSSLSLEALRSIAADLGLHTDEFNKCLNSEAARASVIKDINEAKQVGIQATPTFIINGRLMRGAGSPEEFYKTIEQEIRKKQ